MKLFDIECINTIRTFNRDDNMKYHYVYRITNIVENKHYYGFRSTDDNPLNDIGVKYFSSSTDIEFIEDQQLNSQNYKYKVIKTFGSRDDAQEFESKLLKRFNVRYNENFYNRSDNTFYRGQIIIRAKDVNNGNDVFVTKDEFDDDDNLIGYTKGMMTCYDIHTGEKIRISCKEFHKHNGIKYKSVLKDTKLSDRARKNISKFHTDVSGENNPMFGKHHSAETKQKIALTKIGKPLTSDHKTKLKQRIEDQRTTILDNGMTVMEYNHKKQVETMKNTILENGMTLEDASQEKRKQTMRNRGSNIGFRNSTAKHFILSDGPSIIYKWSGELRKELSFSKCKRVLKTSIGEQVEVDGKTYKRITRETFLDNME